MARISLSLRAYMIALMQSGLTEKQRSVICHAHATAIVGEKTVRREANRQGWHVRLRSDYIELRRTGAGVCRDRYPQSKEVIANRQYFSTFSQVAGFLGMPQDFWMHANERRI